MDTPVALLLLLAFSLVLYRFFYRSNQNVPEVSILEFLPDGVLHPLVKDAEKIMSVINEMIKQYGLVFYSWYGTRRMLFTAVREDVVQLLCSDSFMRADGVQHIFSTVAPGGLFSMPSELHRAVRKRLQGDFNAAMLQGFEAPMNDAIMELCEELKRVASDPPHDGKLEVVDISAVIGMAPLRVITNVAFGSGMDRKQREKFTKTLLAYLHGGAAELIGYPYRQYFSFLGIRNHFLSSKKKFDDMCREFIKRRLAQSKEERQARSPDLLDVFLDVSSGDESLLLSLVVEFAIAGSHTTTEMLAWSIYEICCNEHVAKELDTELERVLGNKPIEEPISYQELTQLEYVHKVWRETLRMHPIVSGFPKKSTSEVTLNGSGIRLAKGIEVVAVTCALHFDPGVWSEPHVFKPERWGVGDVRGEGDRAPPGAYLPFSLGNRSCIGQFVASCEAPLIIAELHRRFRFRLACKREEVVSCGSFIEYGKYSSRKDGKLDMGIPVHVEWKGASCLSLSSSS